MAKTLPVPKPIFDAHNHLRADDFDGSRMIESQNKFGIETTVVMGLPFDGEKVIRKINEQVIRAQQKYPGRLIGGIYCDPRNVKKAIATAKHGYAEGLRLVKLFPNMGYFPDDDKVRPFFDKVAELKMGVLSHCGWLWPKNPLPIAAYYSHPGRFEKLLRIYPETPFIFAHMGGIAGFLEAIMLTTRTPNAYVDGSPGQGLWVLETTGPIGGSVPPAKLLYGADSSYDQKQLLRYRDVYVKLGYGPHLKDIFRNNARGIFEKLGVI